MGQEHDNWMTGLGLHFDTAPESQPSEPPAAVKIATGNYFKPERQVLSPVSKITTVPQNGELTIDLLVKNWDDAPKGTVMRWDVTVDSKAVVAKITNKAGEGYLTLRGMTLGGAGTVKAAVRVKVSEIEVPFEFWPIVFIVGPADTSLDGSRLDNQGGPATNAQLDQDITNLLTDWEGAAKTGIAHFVTKELEKKIDDLSAGSWQSWAENFLGNTLWALTVFQPEFAILKLLQKNNVKFIVSMVGIAVPAILNRPDGHSVPKISELQEMLDDHIMKVHQELKQKLAPQVRGLLNTIPEMTRFEAIGKLAEGMFVPGTVHVDAKYGIVPTINETVVATRYEKMAAARLQKYVDLEKAREAEIMEENQKENRQQGLHRI